MTIATAPSSRRDVDRPEDVTAAVYAAPENMPEVASPRSRIIHPSAWPIAVKLGLVLFTVSLLPMIVTAALDVRQGKQAARDAEHDHLKRLAQSSAGRLAQLLTDTGRVAGQVAGDAEVIEFLAGEGADRASALQTLANVTRSNEDIATVFLIDVTGHCVLSTRLKELTADFSRRPYFAEALSGGSYVSEILAGVSTKLPGVYLANAVKHKARGVVGVAVLKLSGEVITRMVDDVHPNPGGAFLIDSYGVASSWPATRRSSTRASPTSRPRCWRSSRSSSASARQAGTRSTASTSMRSAAP